MVASSQVEEDAGIPDAESKAACAKARGWREQGELLKSLWWGYWARGRG